MTVTDGAHARIPETDDGAGSEPVGYPVPSSLAAALAAVQANLPPIRKGETGKVEGTTKDGKHFSYSYTYADLTAVSAAVLPLLSAHGLSFIAKPTWSGDRFVLAYSLLHESGQREDGEYPLPPTGTPQQIGSAITYGRRYCLCAVTGVAPDDDDDAAAAVGAQAEQSDAEIRHARDAVRGAWAQTFGPYEPQAARRYYSTRFRRGGVAKLDDADAAELRRFAAHLAAIPPQDAGSDPDTYGQATSDAGEKPEAVPTTGPKLTTPQRTKINAIMTRLYGKDRQARLAALSALAGRTVESSSDLTQREAHDVIDQLENDEKTSAGADPVSGRPVDTGPIPPGADDRKGEPVSEPAPAPGPEAPADPTPGSEQ